MKLYTKRRNQAFHLSYLHILGLVSVLTLLILLPLIWYRYHAPQTLRQQAADNTITFTPSIIPLSDPEIGNPGRGPEYYGGEAPPPNWPISDYYWRGCWKTLEPTEGNYDFSQIEQVLNDAKAHNGLGGFRIMALDISDGPGACVPDYLKAMMPKGFTIDGNFYVPDWNDLHYLARLKALFQVLAQKYANDPRLGWIDISGYGCWSEWHINCANNNTRAIQYPSYTGAVDATQATLRTIIDAQTLAFPNKRFLIPLTDRQDALMYALNLQRPKPVGIRSDCLGSPDFCGLPDKLANNPLAQNRWMVAPVYFEYREPDFQIALQDIKTYHASMIGDGAGNLQSFGSYTTADQDLMMQGYKAAGYRFELNSLTLPGSLVTGQQFVVTTHWTNVNYAPTYNPWNVMLQLRNSTGQIVWQGKSSLDLQVPFTASSLGNDKKTVTDTFTLTGNIAQGSYLLALQIIDPNNYFSPLRLAIQGRQVDGSYMLGRVKIGRV